MLLEWHRLLPLALGAAVVPLDTAVNIGFPDITRSFGLTIPMIQWVVICYVLTYASLMLAFGRAGDIFGHARVFRIGLAWSVAAYLLCAAAPAYGWLLFSRFLQGIGAGLVISVAPALVTELFPESRRSRAAAAFTMIFAIASASGPLIGGALVSLWGWPAVFWFRAPIALAGLVLYRRLPGSAPRAMREPLDIVGAILLALTISSLLLFVNEVPHLGQLDRPGLWVAPFAAAGCYAFIRREARFPAPIINLAFFRSLPFVVINLASVLIYLTSFSVLLFVPYYLVRVAGLPLASAGAVLAATFAGTIAASPIAGRLTERLGGGRLLLSGAVLGGVGLIAIGGGSGQPQSGIGLVLAALVVQGFGVGLFQVAYMDVVLGAIPPQHRGVAGSVAMLTRTLGIVGGASLLTLGFHIVETSALANGQAAPAAFLAAFRWIMCAAGALSILTGLAALALPKEQKR